MLPEVVRHLLLLLVMRMMTGRQEVDADACRGRLETTGEFGVLRMLAARMPGFLLLSDGWKADKEQASPQLAT